MLLNSIRIVLPNFRVIPMTSIIAIFNHTHPLSSNHHFWSSINKRWACRLPNVRQSSQKRECELVELQGVYHNNTIRLVASCKHAFTVLTLDTTITQKLGAKSTLMTVERRIGGRGGSHLVCGCFVGTNQTVNATHIYLHICAYLFTYW